MDETVARMRQAVAAHEAGRLEEAEAGYRAILQRGEHEEVLSNLSVLLGQQGRPSEAEAALRRAVEIAPGKAALHYNLGNLCWRTERLEAAAVSYAAALRLDPARQDAALNLGNVRLAQGRFAEGWPLYEQRPERRRALAQPPAPGLPEWRGEPLAGKRLLIATEQGYGDQILVGRFLAQLDAAAVTIACPPALMRLFGQLPARVVERRPGVAVEGDYDCWTLSMSLPHNLRAAPAATPVAPYLAGEARGTGGVGLVWKGNAVPDPGRSLPEPLARELLALPQVTSLHPEDTGAADFQATADLMAGLDLVITIDTSAAHLAGALGKRAWLLLQHHARHDWRWLRGEGRDSFWYPSLEAIAQPAPGDWASVVGEVRRRLAAGA